MHAAYDNAAYGIAIDPLARHSPFSRKSHFTDEITEKYISDFRYV